MNDSPQNKTPWFLTDSSSEPYEHLSLDFSPEQLRFIEEYRAKEPQDLCCKMDEDLSKTQEIPKEEVEIWLKVERVLHETDELDAIQERETRITRNLRALEKSAISHSYIFIVLLIILASSLSFCLGRII